MPPPADAAERARLTFDLIEAGEQLMRQNLRRAHPQASAEQLERLLAAWLAERPGAELGDGEGTPGSWPRKPR